MSVRPFRVCDLSPGRMADWDAFVLNRPEATFFHRSGWKTAIERAYGHHCPYLIATEDNGRIVGILPLTRIKSRLFGHSLVSTGFGVYGGPVGETPEAVTALTDAAVELAARHNVDHIAFRCLGAPSVEAPSGWMTRSDSHATFRKAIDPDPDENLKAIPRKQRAVVRKALERGLRSEMDDTIDRFFPLYAASVRNLGTPVFPKRWFQVLKETFGDDCDILTVLDGGVPICAVMSFYHQGDVLPYYGGGTVAARRGGNDFMYYDLMCRAAARGYRRFDFGRSKTGSGAFSFKKNFGFTPEPLHYTYHVPGGGAVPDVSPNNPKYRAMINIWSRLPLPVANLIGPRIARYLG